MFFKIAYSLREQLQDRAMLYALRLGMRLIKILNEADYALAPGQGDYTLLTFTRHLGVYVPNIK